MKQRARFAPAMLFLLWGGVFIATASFLTNSMASPAAASTLPCFEIPVIHPLIEALNRQPGPVSDSDSWAEFEATLRPAADASARRIFSAYLAGDWSGEEDQAIESCLAPLGFELNRKLGYAKTDAFYSGTVALLGRAETPGLSLLYRKLADSSLRLFNLRGSYGGTQATSANPPAEKKGGFHRGRRSIFLNFSAIPPNEWSVIFIHELGHSLDEKLAAAPAVYADQSLVQGALEWSGKFPKELPERLKYEAQNPAALSPKARAALDRWLLAGLDRGFLAECRAWVFTVALYREGLSAGLWRPIDWLDETLPPAQGAEPLATTVIRSLSPRFADPTDGLFAIPVIAQELKILRARIAAPGYVLQMGQLEKYLHQNFE